MWRLDVSAEAEVEIFEAAPLQFPQLEAEARRALLRRFPYGVFFTVAATSLQCSRYFTSIDIQTPGRIAVAFERRVFFGDWLTALDDFRNWLVRSREAGSSPVC